MTESRTQMSACRRKYAALGISSPPFVAVACPERVALCTVPDKDTVRRTFFRRQLPSPSYRRGNLIGRRLSTHSVTSPRSSVERRSLRDAHRLLEGTADFRRLPKAVPEGFEAGLEQRIPVELVERDAFGALPFLEKRQLDEFGDVGVADHALGVLAARDGVELVEEALADHRNAEVAGADILLGAVGDRALPDPGDDVLVDDVARDPAAVLVLDRAVPSRNRPLHIRLSPFRHAHEEPGDAERVLVVDRHAPLEVIAEIEAVRPQRDASHRPIGIALVRVLADALVDEAAVELLELELQVLAGIGAGLAGEPLGPVVVHPFEVHRVAGVLLALEPVAGHVREHDLAETVLPGERLPDRQLRRQLRAQIGPQQPGAFLHRIGLGGAALLGARARADRVVVGLLDAGAALVHQPAMIIAADAGLLDHAVGEVGAAVRTVPVEQPELAAQILVEHQVLAEQA